MTTKSVTLRDTRDGLDRRRLWATLSTDGTLTVQGQDLGGGVEQVWGSGCMEYEWAETVQSPDIARLAAALGSADVLAALAKRYSDDPAFILKSFLDERGIPYKFWSRVGD